MTAGDLWALEMEGLTPWLKMEIEKCISTFVSSDDQPKVEALRAYLITQCEENDINEKVLEDLPGDAACFCDGWEYCQFLSGK
jgi:uncharacterized cupin superfamily protein